MRMLRKKVIAIIVGLCLTRYEDKRLKISR